MRRQYANETNQKLLSFLFLGGVLSIVSFFIFQLNQNLTAQKLVTGFDFLAQEAGFEISESVIEYDSFMSYSVPLLWELLTPSRLPYWEMSWHFLLGYLLEWEAFHLIHLFHYFVADMFTHLETSLYYFNSFLVRFVYGYFSECA